MTDIVAWRWRFKSHGPNAPWIYTSEMLQPEDYKETDALSLHSTVVELRAELELLKLEMEGVENGKRELGLLLGIEDEFRWKWLRASIQRLKSERALLQSSLSALVRRHSDLVSSGDCGFWNVENEREMIDARAALAKTGGSDG